MTYLTDEKVDGALQHRCPICRTKPGKPCISICDGQPMLQPVHLARIPTGEPR